MGKLVFGIFMVVGLVSSTFGYSFLEEVDEKIQYFKESVVELENLKGKGKLSYTNKQLLLEVKVFLEFAEKVKQSHKKDKKDCFSAVSDVLSDDDNRDKYGNYFWANSVRNEAGCLNIRYLAEDVRKLRKSLK